MPSKIDTGQIKPFGRLSRQSPPLFPGALTHPGTDGRRLAVHKAFRRLPLRLPSQDPLGLLRNRASVPGAPQGGSALRAADERGGRTRDPQGQSLQDPRARHPRSMKAGLCALGGKWQHLWKPSRHGVPSAPKRVGISSRGYTLPEPPGRVRPNPRVNEGRLARSSQGFLKSF